MAAADQDRPTEHSWWRERFAMGALEYPVPARSNRIDFMLGALTMVSLTLLAITGSVLTLYYTPTPLAAHDSVKFIISGAPLAALLRSVHVWSASAALALVFAHLVAVFWRRGFRRPREGLWWTGVLLLALLFGLGFTGTVLRADQEAIEALAHATVGAGMAGPLGAPLRGDFAPSSAVLTRLYGLHIAVIPLALFALLALHLWLIRHLGVSARHEKLVPFRKHLRPLAGFALILTALATILAMVWPAALLAPGVEGFEVTKPFWPFLWIYAAENLFGMTGMLVAPGLLFGFLALVPLSDRTDGRAARLTRATGVVLFVLMLAAIAYAALAPAEPHLGMAM
ncbi:MAG TPA: cytochrome b N-terminal domain-containing protein [Gemmatimonadales bacterium]|nr:cytochrome b N-terminal domain-containing protein [Gemmatimonadales bacterium]